MAELRCSSYRLLEPVGRGARASVWRGEHVESGEPAAIKVLHEQSEASQWAFLKETIILSRLEHPNIIELLASGRVKDSEEPARLPNGAYYLVLPYLPERSLADRPSPRDWPLVRGILSGLLDGLHHCHQRGIIHRDIKTENLLLRRDEQGQLAAVLSDFGAAHADIDELEQDRRSEELTGTLSFMPPEQLEARWQEEGPWTDLYPVGAMCYELLGGSWYIQSGDRQECLAAQLQQVPPLRSRCPVPEKLQSWLDRMVAQDPRDRFGTAAEARQSLLELEEPRRWRGPRPERA